MGCRYHIPQGDGNDKKTGLVLICEVVVLNYSHRRVNHTHPALQAILHVGAEHSKEQSFGPKTVSHREPSPALAHPKRELQNCKKKHSGPPTSRCQTSSQIRRPEPFSHTETRHVTAVFGRASGSPKQTSHRNAPRSLPGKHRFKKHQKKDSKRPVCCKTQVAYTPNVQEARSVSTSSASSLISFVFISFHTSSNDSLTIRGFKSGRLRQ